MALFYCMVIKTKKLKHYKQKKVSINHMINRNQKEII